LDFNYLRTSASDDGFGVATDSSANVYITGYSQRDLDGSSNAGSYDVFLWKYDAADSYEVTVTAELLITIPRLTYKGNYYSAKLDHNGTCWTARDVNAVE